MSNIKINHDLIGQLFYAKVLGGTAELHYDRYGDDYLDFVSTSVPEASRKFGIGSELIENGIAFAKEQQLKVKATCPFVQDYLEKKKPNKVEILAS